MNIFKKVSNWLHNVGMCLIAKAHKEEKGEINLGGFIFMAVGLIFIAVGFIIYPIVISGTDGILAWTATVGGTAFATANFTGMTSVVPIVPLIVALGFIVSTILAGYMGVKNMRGGDSEMNPSSYLIQGVGMIFIGVSLIVFPIIMTGVATAWSGILSSSYSSSYSAVAGFLPVAPLLALVGTVFIGVCAEYFGIRKSVTGSFN